MTKGVGYVIKYQVFDDNFLNSINNIVYRCIFTSASSISNQCRKAENKECIRHVCVYIVFSIMKETSLFQE